MKQHQEPQKPQPKCQLPYCRVLGNNRQTSRSHFEKEEYPAVGGTHNAACYETGIGNRQRPLLEVKTQSAFVPWYSEERGTMKAAVQLTGQANEFCSSVNSRKTNFVGQRKFSMSMFKLFGQSKCRFSLCSTETEVLYSLLKFFYVSLVLTAFYNSLRHSLL